MRLGSQRKPDQARLDYDIDYAELGLLEVNEIIQTVAVTVTGTDELLLVDSIQHTDTVAKAWLSGGTAGHTYEVTQIMATNQGRIYEDCYKIRITRC